MFLESTREVRLASRPLGLPSLADFELVETPVAPLKAGEVLVKNLWMSVDPYMRGRMSDRPSYVLPFQIGKALEGGAIGEVMESMAAGLNVGDTVSSAFGWREHFVAPADQVQKVDPTLGPLQSYLGTLGMTGMTAWTGLTRIGELRAGETVFVSAASGAVGTMVVQIARQLGARVVASVGSEEKATSVRRLGADAVIQYRQHKTVAELDAALREAAPEGVDVYFDNVGGTHLEAALGNMKRFGRVVACGMIDQYNAPAPVTGPANLAQIVIRSLRVQGFIVRDHWSHYPEFIAQMAGWMREGKIESRDTVREGLEAAPDAFIGLFRGDNIGKMLVKLA